jgi:hypothetical protein
MFHRLLVGVVALAGLAILELASAAPHPFYDDGGAVHWRPYQQAFVLAQKYGRPVFIEVSKDKDKLCEKLVVTSFKDERISQFLNRYFVPVSLDFTKQPAEMTKLIGQAGKAPPIILLLNEKGQYLQGLSGFKKPNEIEGELIKVLEEKYGVPKAKDAEIEKKLELLAKAVEDKAWAKAKPLFNEIVAIRGYSAMKDKAYEVMDAAQADGNAQVKEAYGSVRKDDYAEAKKGLEKVIKDFSGAPVADQAKEHLAAVKVMEFAHQCATDAKVNRKAEAVRQLDGVLGKYGDTPYAGLAQSRKKDLTKTPGK